MHTFFNAQFFTHNRKKLRDRLSSDAPIVITANGNMQRAADEPFKFVQDSNFWYLTGLNVAELTLVITKTDSFLIAPELSTERQAFDGAYDLADITARSGITTILDEREGWQRVREAIAEGHSVATLGTPRSYETRHRLHTLPYRRRLLAKLKRLDPQASVQDIRPLLVQARCIKQPEELRALQRAIDITAETLQDVTMPAALSVVTHEYQLEAALSYGFRFRGADGHAFEPIVGAGQHGTTLHHVNNDGAVQKGDLIVLDVGASVDHYAADITRTVCQQPMTARQAAVFQAVANVQDYALGLLKPGTLLRDYEEAVALHMGQQLQELGLISTPNHAAIRHYFPHATSHFLGLDTHDVGDYSQPLAANMVLTCEPGIYIPEEGIGVRLEDDVLITATGSTVLSAACPQVLTPVQ